MNISLEKGSSQVVIHMDGRFDFGARKEFKEHLDQAVEEQLPIILELGQVAFVDSSALGLLVIAHQTLKNKKIPFYLVNPQIYVKQVLDLANIGKMIPIYQTLEEVPCGLAVPFGSPT